MKSFLWLLLVSLALLSALSFARPDKVGSAFRDYDELRANHQHSDDEPGKIKRKFHQIDYKGRITNIDYDVEVSDNIYFLNDDETIDEIICEENKLTLTVDNAQGLSDSLSIGKFLVGGPGWGCTSVTGHAAPIYQEVVSMNVASSTQLEITTTQVGINQLFKSAKCQFSTNQYLPNSFKVKGSEDQGGSAQGAGSSRRRSWLGDVVSDIGSAVDSVVSDVKSGVEEVIDTVKDLGAAAKEVLSGNFAVDTTKTYNFDYNSDARVAFDLPLPGEATATATCDDCFATLDVTLGFNLDISDFHLNRLLGNVTGEAEVKIVATTEVTDTLSSDELEIELLTITGPTVTFFIGPVPVVLQFDMPIFAGFSASLTVSGHITFTADVVGTVDFGAGYDDSQGGWVHYYDDNADFTGGVTTGYSGSVSTRVSITPRLRMLVEGMISVYLDPTPYVVVNASLSTDNQACTGPENIDIGIYAGIEFAVGSDVDITVVGQSLFQQNLATLSIYNYNQLVNNYCWNVAKKRAIAATAETEAKTSFPKTQPWIQRVGPSNVAMECEKNCNGNGICHNGDCVCYAGFLGKLCNQKDPAKERRRCRRSNRCPGGGVVVKGLKACACRNGKKVCPAQEDHHALDAKVGEMLDHFAEYGPVCMDHIAPMLCSMYFPEVHKEHGNDVHQVCFDQCTDVFEKCGFKKKASTQMCRQASTNRLSNIQRRGEDFHECEDKLNTKPSGHCEVAKNLKACPSANGKRVFVHDRLFDNAKQADKFVKQLVKKDQLDERIGDKACKKGLEQFYCSEYLPECDDHDQPLKMCADACEDTFSKCKPKYQRICRDHDHIFASAYVEQDDNAACGYALPEESDSSDSDDSDSHSPVHAEVEISQPSASGLSSGSSHKSSSKSSDKKKSSSSSDSSNRKKESSSSSGSGSGSGSGGFFLSTVQTVSIGIAGLAVIVIVVAVVVFKRVRSKRVVGVDQYGKFRDQSTST